MSRDRSRSGYTIIATLVVIIIIGLLYSRQIAAHFKPVKPPIPGGQATLQDEAKVQVFRLVADQVKSAISVAEAGGSPRPRTWLELGRIGISTLTKDPWGGQYYLKDGYLRCTGNPKIWEKL